MMATPLEFSVDLAQQAGAYLMDAFHLSGTVASQKPDRSFVTEADVTVDNLITRAIHAHYPGEAVLSEELHTSLSESSPAIWIDPQNPSGRNYKLQPGITCLGSADHTLKDGWPETSVLYFPLLKECIQLNVARVLS